MTISNGSCSGYSCYDRHYEELAIRFFNWSSIAFFAVRNIVENKVCWFGDARVRDAPKFTVSLHFYRFPLIPFLRGGRAQLAVLVHMGLVAVAGICLCHCIVISNTQHNAHRTTERSQRHDDDPILPHWSSSKLVATSSPTVTHCPFQLHSSHSIHLIISIPQPQSFTR